jgi:hypothetical protein
VKGQQFTDTTNFHSMDYGDEILIGGKSYIENSRFINLHKLYPIIPKMLNDFLVHFSQGAHVYYEFVEELIEDLNRCRYSIFE